jgi:16S rRNA (guanine1516-N2)-methyltransferase
MVSDHIEKKICVISEGESELAAKWAGFLKAPLNPAQVKDYFFQLLVEGDKLLVRDQEGRKLAIDFDENHLDYERRGHRGKNELISKALGLSKGYKRVLDLSVGMAIDSVFLTQLGFQVIGVERSPLLYALLSEAFARTEKEYLKNYQLYFDDALNFLKTKKDQIAVDCIYFDPMYPHKKKSALPKQEMMVFRDLVGHDDDASLVLQEALTWNVKRVVVKRPLQAEVLLPGVRHSFEGKVVRYDTYVVG